MYIYTVMRLNVKYGCDFISKARALFYNVGIGNVLYSQALQCIAQFCSLVFGSQSLDSRCVPPTLRSSVPYQLTWLVFAADMFGLALVTECHLFRSCT